MKKSKFLELTPGERTRLREYAVLLNALAKNEDATPGMLFVGFQTVEDGMRAIWRRMVWSELG
jgi:hypothetical protein